MVELRPARRVVRAEDFYSRPHMPADMPVAERVLDYWERHNRVQLPRPDQTDVLRPVLAYVNHGRWVADCDCNSAQVVSPADPRFLCPECVNAVSGGRWRPVLFPADPAEIEATFDEATPDRQINWHPDPNNLVFNDRAP